MNMASCLFDCLCEAELEKYYPQFLEVGLQKIEQLAKITMKDYSSLGVNNMEDRKHLFQLIKIIQSVAEEDSERTPLQPGCGHLQPMKNRSGPRRQLQFDSSLEKNQNLFPHSEFCDFPHNYAIKNPEDVIETSLPADQRHGRTISSAGLDTNTAKGHHSKPFSGRGMANSSNGNEVPTIHRVNHVSGYNYGVPQNCLRPSVSDREGSWMETEKIRVCVRKRPLSLREERRGEMDVVTVEDKETLLIYEKKEAVNLKEYILQHVFYFDEVFSESFTNKDVYMKTAHPLIQHIFNGGNATCFAYGQTGAGKTYTMIGTAKNPGLYALTARDIFQQLESAQSRKEYFVLISFYEIYCGQLYDLLNGRKRLFAREDGNHVVQIVGLREVQVSTVDLLLEMILKGSRERSTGATGVNSDSSRSHAIIQIQIKDAASRKLGRISFVDLAGSERASDARESDKQTKIEGAEINQSLLALKECIRALDQEQAHTPFRQSKLTQVLKDSFIGNSKTCMIANVSPSHIATEHTLNTLRYADRVKELKKGMKCSPLSSNRTQTISLSPKRMQNSSFVFGDKFSPKKVKLGLQNNSTPNAGKSKGCPSVFHPGNIPFSSTPKNVNKTTSGKGNLSQAWLNHTTPVKGIIRPGSNVKKKREEQILHDNKIIPKNSSTKSDVRSEKGGIGQENNIAHNSRPSVSQRIQAVQPVQKQIVPKAALHGVQSFQPSSDCHPDSLNRPLGPDMECWTSKFPLQKEREQHLRCYHQQFQHPPILQQKLQYQPLEKTPEHYTPQELKLENSSSPKLPSCSQHEERVVLEDFDDSDFSEDSFSYSSNHKEGRKNESERLSFFLHQKSPLSETTTSVEREQGTDYAESHEHNWRSLCGSELARSNCKVDNVGGTENKALWSAEDCSSVCDSSKISNTPEKPYSSQDSPSQSKVYFFKRDNTARGNIAHLSSFSELQEKCDRLISMIESGSDKTDKATRKVEVRNCEKHHDEAVSMSSDSVSGLMAPLSVSLLQDNWPVDCAELSDRSGYQANNLNFKEAWSLDAQVDSANNISTESSIARNVSEMVKRILISKTTLNMQNSLHKENKYLSHACNHFDFHSSAGCPPFSIQQDDKGSARRENLRPSAGSRPSDSFSVKDASIDFAVTSYSENPVSQCYEADTEETPVGMKFVKNEPRLEEIVSNGSLENAEENKESISHNLPPDNSRNNANVYFNCNNQFQQLERNVGNLDEKGLEDSYILSFNDNELECLRTKLIKYIFAQKSVKEKPISSNEHTVTQKNPKYKLPVDSQTNASDMSCVQAQSAERARQLVIQAHREQLNEMTALCTREEILLNNLPSSDFKEYVTELDEIMLLKFKSIQSMRDQLKQFLASPRTEDATHTTPGL